MFSEEEIFRKKIWVTVHTPVPHSIAQVRGIYQEDQIRVYMKEKNPQLFTIIQFGYLE
jgi:hypothetical protein